MVEYKRWNNVNQRACFRLEEEKLIMEKGNDCVLFLLAVALTVLGVFVLTASLGSLGVTTSFLRVFPFGSPIWCGALVRL